MSQPNLSRGNPAAPSRRIVSAGGRRDLLIALVGGAAVLAFLIYAFIALSRQSAAAGGVEGIITSKDFTPRQETQITVGRDGVSSRQLAGEYAFRVRVSGGNGREYTVQVDPVVYDAHAVGDRFYFVPAPPTAAAPGR